MEEVRDEQASTQGNSPMAGGLPTLTYSQSSGLMQDSNGATVAVGWSGNGAGKNNPAMQDVHNVGPLPQGLYRVGPWHDHGTMSGESGKLGPMVAHLEQIQGETFGRDAFFIHGPSGNPAHYGQESEGCIVIPRAQREAVKAFGPGFVQVVA